MQWPVIVHDRLPETALEQVIQVRAYDLFLRRGRIDGHAIDDWLEAEGEVTREQQPYRSWSLS